jgi:hypothetical protein
VFLSLLNQESAASHIGHIKGKRYFNSFVNSLINGSSELVEIQAIAIIGNLSKTHFIISGDWLAINFHLLIASLAACFDSKCIVKLSHSLDIFHILNSSFVFQYKFAFNHHSNIAF